MRSYSCISHHQMNVVNTRTNILYIHGCHTRTDHKEMPIVTPSKHSLLKRHHQSKPSSNAKSFWEDPYTVAWGHATSSVGEYVGTQKCHFFIHFIFYYSSHFIVPLTFYHTISIHICGSHLIISTLFIFSIISEFMIKY